MEHTKTPWKYFDNECGDFTICTEDESSLIATVGTDFPHEEGKANAERIVKCVNIHDELVEFLKELEFNYRGTDTAVRAYELIKKAKE